MTPDRRKLVTECLAPGESELYHTTVTSFTGTKEDIEWLKAFRNGELKKRTAYQRLNLIEDSRIQIEKWEAKAKRDAETPVECPKCGTAGFLPAGLKSHLPKCKGVKRNTSLAPLKAIDGKATVITTEDLPSLSATIAWAQESIDDIDRKAMMSALPHKLRQGLACLKAQSLFSIADPAERGAMGGRPKSSSGSDEVSDPDAKEPASDIVSFESWIATQPISKGSAYDYMKAVVGLGLDHAAGEADLADALSAALAKNEGSLSITKLKNLAPPPEIEVQPDPNTPEDKAGEARVQVHEWISRWDEHEKTGGLEDADVPTLKQVEEFLSNTLSRIRARLKSAPKS